MKPKNYQKDFDYSYTLGVYPTLELFKYHSTDIVEIFYHSAGDKNSGLDQIKTLCRQKSLSCTQNNKLVDQLSDSNNTYVIGVFKKYFSFLDPRSNHLVLVGPRDMGNLGTIIRTMVGFEFANLALIRPAADIFHPKAIRASMGELFQINCQYFNTFADYQKEFPRNYYSFMTDGRHLLESTKFNSLFSLIFGSESSGLGPEFHQLAQSIRIKQSPKIDSLNLAMSIGITLHQLYSQS